MLVVGGGGCELFLLVDATKVPKADLLNCGGVVKCPANAQIKSTASFGNFTGVWPPGFSNIPTGVCSSGFQQRPVLITGSLTFFVWMTNTKSLLGQTQPFLSLLATKPQPFLFLLAATPSRIRLIDGIAGH